MQMLMYHRFIQTIIPDFPLMMCFWNNQSLTSCLPLQQRIMKQGTKAAGNNNKKEISKIKKQTKVTDRDLLLGKYV